tara:strand:+ start:2801 stop:3094 length:294 start_codon:yes stop_codon:yes gene_type:complete
MATMYSSGLSQVSTKREKKPEPIKEIAKPFPSSAPTRMHKKYYENNIDNIRDIYKEQGIEIPNYFSSASDYADYRRSQKMYGGKVQPRGAMRTTETR